MQSALQKSKISILLPDSFLDNEDTLLLKTRKIGTLARTTNMFRIGYVYFYKEKGQVKDREILSDIFTHLGFPPYLRKYGKHSKNLRHTAILQPIHSPNHSGVKYKEFSYSEGIVTESFGGKISVDIGKKNSVIIRDKRHYKKGDTVIIQSSGKSLCIKEIVPDTFFWKTSFEIGDLTLDQYLLSNPQNFVIGLSKSGEPISSKVIIDLQNNTHSQYLLVFGPIKGSLRDHIKNLNSINIWLNVVPNQGTKTIKIEEALHSTLTLLNLCSLNLK
jgi:predicted SPOUT superfamily RNA methylase MTH1